MSLKCKSVLFVQNPSIILALQACLLKKILGIRVIVDRHSNFMLGRDNKRSIKFFLFNAISNFTLKHADITIVTNSQIAKRAINAGGNPAILPDPLPDLTKYSIPIAAQCNDLFSIFFPSSWANDEPLSEVAELCRRLKENLIVYVSGKPKVNYLNFLKNTPDNFVITGYLSDYEYFTLMSKCHAVMPLTVFPELLVCGGYEGVSLEKPLILGDTPTLREYFCKGAVFTKCTTDELSKAVVRIKEEYPFLKKDVVKLKEELLMEWPNRLQKFNQMLEQTMSKF
jgi:hypothetical protein